MTRSNLTIAERKRIAARVNGAEVLVNVQALTSVRLAGYKDARVAAIPLKIRPNRRSSFVYVLSVGSPDQDPGTWIAVAQAQDRAFLAWFAEQEGFALWSPHNTTRTPRRSD